MRDAGDYDKLGMTWAKFCEWRADISPKCHGDQRRQVRHRSNPQPNGEEIFNVGWLRAQLA